MTDMSSGKILIEAPLSKIEGILFDLGQYPLWSTAIKSVVVLEKDDKGRATSATISIDAGMMRDRVTLEYDWSQAPGKLSFSMTDADLLTAMEGSYTIVAPSEEITEVTYELQVDLSMPIPAMMRHKAEKATIDMVLGQLKTFAEKE